MFARKIGIFSSFSKKALVKPHLLVGIPRASLHVELIRDIGVGTSKKLYNNYNVKDSHNDQYEEQYKRESWNEFKKSLIPNRLHIFVCPARLLKISPYISPGHVASFVTDNNAEIINGSVMSLQNGNYYFDANNKIVKIWSNIRGNRFPDYLKEVNFVQDMQIELREHMFNKESSTFKSTHHLFSLPITEIYFDKILKNIENTISKHKNDLFQLFNAKIDDELHKALNCCFGLYRAMGVKGKIDDPSPQMVTWSLILFIYKNFYNDESLRDKLLEGSGLKENSEFQEDDDLEWETPRP